MKKLITLMALFTVTGTFASSTGKFFTTKIQGSSEAEVVANAEAIIPTLSTGDYRPARREMNAEGCTPLNERYIKVQSLTVNKFYNNENGTLVPVFTGSLRYYHKSCRDRD